MLFPVAHNVKMLLVGCSGDETADLTRDIHKILRTEYGLEDQVEMLLSMRRGEVDPEMEKGHRSPLVTDYFADSEVQADIGRNQLKDIVRGKHIVLVEHLLTPARKVGQRTVSPNDHIMAVRGMLDLFNGTETLLRTLAAPYSSYIRSHSVEDYERHGFHQFDSLRMTLKDFARDGLDTIVTIDPHSDKAAQLAQEMGIDYHSINPFRSGRSQSPYKLGLSGRSAHKTLKTLRPFQERFAKMVKEYGEEHVYLVAVDDGTERRVENFADRAFGGMKPEEFFAKIAYLNKDRRTYDGAETAFKRFSQINAANIDEEGIYIIIDDMFASGGTAMKAGQIFKDGGAKRVEVWTSHAVTMPEQYEKANRRDGADKVVCLDTVPQSANLDIEYIKASGALLSSELFKVHEKLAYERAA